MSSKLLLLLEVKIIAVGRTFYPGQMDLGAVHFADRMNIHQQFWSTPTHYIGKGFFWYLQVPVFALGNHGMAADRRQTLDGPVFHFFLFEAAFVADPAGAAVGGIHYFSPFVFTGGYPEDFIPPHPQLHFAAAF